MSQAATHMDEQDHMTTQATGADAADVFVFPTSFPQRRLWFLDQLMPGGSSYNLTSVYRLTGRLDIAALEKSFSEIVSRHEILRTTFKSVDGEPMQIVSESNQLRLPVADLHMLQQEEREVCLRQMIDEETKRIFDLETGPLLVFRLVKMSDNEHVLIKNIHHIITDAWSEDIFISEWKAFYQSFIENTPVSAPALPIQYADFSEWQRQVLQGEEVDRQFDYWKNKLAGLPTLNLPTDHPRPATADYAGSAVSFVLPASVTQALKSLSKREGVTLFTTLLTAYKILLSRYSGQSDVVVGTPITNRNRSELEHLIGFFLNTLVLRTDISGNPDFLHALRSVRDTTLGAFAHQDLPFEILVEKLQPERNLSLHPLCQAMFVLLREGEKSWQTGGVTVYPVKLDISTAKFDVVLSLTEREETIEGSLIYGTALFDRQTVERMAAHFQTLLGGILENPAQPITALSMLSSAERQELLVDWNNTAVPTPLTPVHELVAAQCAKTPEAVAIDFAGKKMTYGELNRQAQRVAAHLRSLDATPGDLIGICVERSPEMIAALLGILQAGCAYVPLDPEFPSMRLEAMIADARPPIIITQRSVAHLVPKSNAHIVDLHGDWPAGEAGCFIKLKPDDLAYVLFTSGSTGRPKGVQIPHGALTNLLESMRARPGLSGADVLLAVTTLSFDIAGLEIFLPLICGARIILASREMALDARQLVEILDSGEVTVMQATPATWRALLAVGWKGLPKLKILCGGEAMPTDLAAALLPRCGSLWNVYGPTETTIWSTVEKVESTAKPITVGRPIANTTLYILDERMEPQPVGVYGELFIGGLGVARGYLGRADLTSQKFVANPFGQPGERIYRTGDLARYRVDGSVEFLGRIDHQVKVRGFRIELGEIESTLGKHPDVQQCVVVARDDGHGEKRLVAYAVVRSAMQDSDIRAFLKNKLPDYMVPSVFVFLDALPLTPNGKVDRKALPEPDRDRITGNTFVAPRTPLEIQLAEIWAHALGMERVSVQDDFFAMGGHSLMAVSLFMEIEKKLEKKLPLATLFQAPTIEQLAAVIQQEGWTAPWSPLVSIQPRGDRPPFFCTHGADGAVLFYSKLASLLGADQPVYGLQAQGLDGGQIQHTTTESMAALYIKEIRSVQPHGPYYLGGYSFGGLLALEMAQQLRGLGEQVAFVALFDANNPAVPPRRYSLKERIALRMRSIAGMSLGGKLSYIWDRGVRKLAVMAIVKKEKLRRMAYRFSSRRNEIVPADYRIVHVREANDAAMHQYRPKSYDGRLTLIRAENPNDGFEFDELLGWGSIAADGVEVVDVPGEHETMFHEPHVHALAKQMRECIEKAGIRASI